jgi:hypothetical protein
MPSERSSDSDTTTLLVERYLSPTAADSLAASVARVAQLCADMSHSGPSVQYITHPPIGPQGPNLPVKG